ncbi:hypothetical protein ILUMI_15278 [Ignelater luminosus]|uniref:PiggyBac transposable element-derived protein domain-containing protein n=1 Tax=Ignelater luminosus TaxID=2038154 RepID=A0A8K0G413_IGNLU|nr:hypothetical protein ILUMI_15278 [Ignelater luminosus]
MTSNDVDIVVLPPDPDELTDEDDADYSNLQTVEVSDVPGELILQYKLPDNSEQSETCEQEDINLPDSKTLGKEERGSFDYRFDTNVEILIVKWNDNKCVTIATNFDTIEPLNKASRWDRKAKEKRYLPQPRLVKQYNNNMS